MGNSNFNLNQRGVDDLMKKIADEAQAKLNATLRAVMREVRDEMSGQPSEAVLAELKTRITQRIPGFQIDEENLRQYADAIEEGTLSD